MNLKKWLLPLCAAAALALCWYLGTLVSPEELRGVLTHLGDWAVLGYIGLFAVLPSFFFPVAVLALAGGLLFGLLWGTVYTLIGAVLNCTLMFFMAKYLGRARIEAMIQKRLSPQCQERLKNLNGRTGFLLLILLRLIPAVPYNLINYAFGLSGMGYQTYITASVIGIIPGTLAFINIGDKAPDPGSPDFWLALGLLGLLLVVTALLGKKLFPKEEKENTNG